jgi:hypothetical protein
MTDEQINIAIAEACGRAQRPDGNWYPIGSTVGSAGIPNCCNDLNAMHESERVALKTHARYYSRALMAVCNRHPTGCTTDWDTACTDLAELCNATARQRSEALLKTLGKWREGV